MDWQEGWDSVAEYCTGNGIDVCCGHTPAPGAVGIDVVPGGEEYAPDHLSQALLCYDCLDLPFKDEVLDFVFCSHGLEHVPDVEAALREWARVLKPGGYLCCVTPDRRYVYFEELDEYHGLLPYEVRPLLERIPDLEVVRFDTYQNQWAFDLVARKAR